MEFQEVSFRYGADAPEVLTRLSFRVARGEAAFLSGDNGTGKSTVLRMVNGLLLPTGGVYTFLGETVDRVSMGRADFARRLHQRIGFVFQDPDVQLFNASVQEELAFGPRQMGLSEAETARRVEDALRLLDIAPLRDRVPYGLSGGEKRRVSIASVLTMNPAVWTMDEPEAFLDRRGRDWLGEFLTALKAGGKTLLISTHDAVLQARLADRVISLDRDEALED